MKWTQAQLGNALIKVTCSLYATSKYILNFFVFVDSAHPPCSPNPTPNHHLPFQFKFSKGQRFGESQASNAPHHPHRGMSLLHLQQTKSQKLGGTSDGEGELGAKPPRRIYRPGGEGCRSPNPWNFRSARSKFHRPGRPRRKTGGRAVGATWKN